MCGVFVCLWFLWCVPPPAQLKVNVDQKHLAEARAGILSILHTIMSSVTLLWSVLHQADSSDKPAVASGCSTSLINLGSTKVRPHLYNTNTQVQSEAQRKYSKPSLKGVILRHSFV